MKLGRLLVMVPLGLEVKELVRSFQSLGYQKSEELIGNLKVYFFKDLQIHIAQGGHGKVQFAIQTQFLLSKLDSINQVICAGSSGSLVQEILPTSIVIGTSTIEHDFKVEFIKKPQPEFQADSSLISDLKLKLVDRKNVYFAKIASGDEDVLDQNRAQQINFQTGASVVAWEGAGAARVCKFVSIPFLEIRGVTDMADKNAIQDFQKNLSTIMNQISEILILISKSK